MPTSPKNLVKRIGLPPGTLMVSPHRVAEQTKISLAHWTAESLTLEDEISTSAIREWVAKEGTTWIMVEGINDIEVLRDLGKIFDLHPLMLEDISDTSQRPKLDDYVDKIFIILELQRLLPQRMYLENEQFSIIFGKNYIITFAETSNSIVQPIMARLNKPHSPMRSSGPDYTAYLLFDLVVDSAFQTIDGVNDVLTRIETELLIKPPKNASNIIQKTRKLVWNLRTGLLPMEEVAGQFRRIDSPLIQKSTKFYMHDVSDHIFQGLDMIESFRDITLSLLDIYRSYQNQRMNEVMRTLTIVATIFVPLTFISSMYGMNFKYMPELEWHYGYPVTLGVMAATALGMLFYFRKKDWL
jgi:magnesium transporter